MKVWFIVNSKFAHSFQTVGQWHCSRIVDRWKGFFEISGCEELGFQLQIGPFHKLTDFFFFTISVVIVTLNSILLLFFSVIICVPYYLLAKYYGFVMVGKCCGWFPFHISPFHWFKFRSVWSLLWPHGVFSLKKVIAAIDFLCHIYMQCTNAMMSTSNMPLGVLEVKGVLK